ncbi:MAG: uroporphyrinogen-III synthase [Actinomycetes bacterium]|nr:uroporphyrinogen-III synthase [Actinomycetes bacterium]
MTRTIILTRRREQSSELAAALTAHGVCVLYFPTIALAPPPDEAPIRAALGHLDSYDWLLFTSANAVERFFRYMTVGTPSDRESQLVSERTAICPQSVRKAVPTGCAPRVAAVGTATAAALERRGIRVDMVPQDFRAEGLIAEFERIAAAHDTSSTGNVSGQVSAQARAVRILLPRALKAREILPEQLKALGFTVDVAPVYQTLCATPTPDELAELTMTDGSPAADGIVFASPSAARNFADIVNGAGMDALTYLKALDIIAIGEVTAETVRELGVRPIVAAAASVGGIVSALGLG